MSLNGAEGGALSRKKQSRSAAALCFKSSARDGCRMAETAQAGMVYESPVGEADVLQKLFY